MSSAFVWFTSEIMICQRGEVLKKDALKDNLQFCQEF